MNLFFNFSFIFYISIYLLILFVSKIPGNIVHSQTVYMESRARVVESSPITSAANIAQEPTTTMRSPYLIAAIFEQLRKTTLSLQILCLDTTIVLPVSLRKVQINSENCHKNLIRIS